MAEVISLINEKGGVGKSTSAITIAQILAISEYKVLLIDLDPQMNTTKMFGQSEANPEIDYEHLFCVKQKSKDAVMNFITETDYDNISILTASRELNSLIYKIYDKMKETNVELYLRYNLNLIKDEFDYIIIDNSPFKSYLTSCAMCASDKIITPICVDNFSYDGLMSLLDTIEELNANLEDILHDVEKKALVSLDGQVEYKLTDKIKNGKLYVDQGIIAGCAGGGFENICAAADILKGKSIGADEFTLSVYPASTPIYVELARNGRLADLMETGAIVKTAFCGPCFGAGDTPANNAFSIRHSTRNFPNREGSKLQNGQISSVALMDARSIAATAANKGFLTAATDMDVEFTGPAYHFDSSIYANRVFDSKGVADPDQEIQFGPNIKDWPEMVALPENLIIKVVSEIHDPVTTTDELIPSGETSSYRSNPLGLAEFALSRKDPAYVGRAKEVQKAEKAREAGQCMGEALPELREIMHKIKETYDVHKSNVGVGSTIFAVKPGDGSAREQAASCQKVLGGWANIANEYATKRYRSNLINWGMLPFIIDKGELPFENEDYIFIPEIQDAIKNKVSTIKAFVVNKDMKEFELKLGELTDDERQIILDGCLINYYRENK